MKSSKTKNVSSYKRREFLKMGGLALTGLTTLNPGLFARETRTGEYRIKDIQIDNGVSIIASDGTTGYYKGSSSQDLDTLRSHLPVIKKLFLGKDPLDRNLDGEMLWEV